MPIVIERLSVQEGFRFEMDDAEVRVNTTLLQLLALHGAAPREGRRHRELGARLEALKAETPRAHEAAEMLAACCRQLAAAQGAASAEAAALSTLHERAPLDALRYLVVEAAAFGAGLHAAEKLGERYDLLHASRDAFEA